MVIAAAPLVYYDLGRDGCGVGEFSSCVRQSVYVFPGIARLSTRAIHALCRRSCDCSPS